MKGKKVFSISEARSIRALLVQLARTPSEEKKGVRDQLRSLGFYITDFTNSKAGFRAEDFDSLVSSGQVSVSN